jgi:signal transduction histidine kinase
MIIGDKDSLEKMLVNLINNSIIYGNNNGHTEIELRKSKSYINIDVIDDGIGISKEDTPHVFERFYRADKSHNSAGNRSGLGLAIVKWTAEVHGGEVVVKSNKNQGSTFTVTLPIKARS